MAHTQESRNRAAREIEQIIEKAAHEVTEEFLARHPDWLDRYGERARELGIEDARYHMRFLVGSITAGSPNLYEDYTRWTARMLQARGIAPTFLKENLAQIRDVLESKLERASAAIAKDFISKGELALDAPLEAEDGDGDDAKGLARTSRLFTQAALGGERKATWSLVVEALREGTDPLDIYVHVLQDSLYRIGRLWESNRITVAQEHMATAITQYVVSMLYGQLEIATEKRGRMVLTGVPGELHQVGAMMMADVLEADGWDVRFLGTNTPIRDIVSAVKEHNPNVLGVSVTMAFNIPIAQELVAACRKAMGEQELHIIVGGGAWRHTSHAYLEVGAESCATDIISGLEQLRDLQIA